MSLLDRLWRETCARFDGRNAITFEPGGRASTFAEIERKVAAKGMSRSLLAGEKADDPMDIVVTFLAALRSGRPFVAFDRSMPAAARADLIERLERTPLPSGTAMIKLTSGSTGGARGVAIGEESLLADARNIAATMQLGPDDVNLAALSLAHSYGFDNLVLPLIVQGTPMVVVDPFAPRAVLEVIVRARVTFVPLVPVMYEALLPFEGDWSPVRRCISAGATLDPDLAARFHARTGRKIHTFYGSTECGGIAFDRSDEPILPRGSVGTPLDGVEVDFTPEGRVRVHSKAVALGYLPDEGCGSLERGTFVTGDLGRFDEAGRLQLTGRAADLINVAGRKVAPAEIEACLMALSGVRAAVVVGMPDALRGESIGALVVAPDFDESRLLAHCRRHLPAWKAPRLVRLTDRLPYDERGKISKDTVRSLLDRS